MAFQLLFLFGGVESPTQATEDSLKAYVKYLKTEGFDEKYIRDAINPQYQQYLITGVEDGWIKVDRKTWDEYQMMKDPDYRVGKYS